MRRPLPWLVAAIGVTLALAGVLVSALPDGGPADFGWSADTPLQDTPTGGLSTGTFSDGTELWTGRSSGQDGALDRTELWTGRHLLGAGLRVLGLLVLTTALVGLLGRRAGRHGAHGSDDRRVVPSACRAFQRRRVRAYSIGTRAGIFPPDLRE